VLRQALTVAPLPHALTFFLMLFSGWVNRQQHQSLSTYSRRRVFRAVNGPMPVTARSTSNARASQVSGVTSS
jgi:hypothetical protein